MPTLRPYSAKLAHGTLMMIHAPTTSVRFARMERLIDMESVGMLCTGGVVGVAGWVGRETAMLLAGIMLFVAGLISWSARRLGLNRRRNETPRMIFVSDDGVGAILPNNSSMFVEWHGLVAHEFCYLRGRLPNNVCIADNAMRGVMLKSPAGLRLYLTHDLDGYEELLEIIVELEIPIHVAGSSILNARGGFIDWRRKLERRTWEERN